MRGKKRDGGGEDAGKREPKQRATGRKIVFFGPPAAGKTTLKKIFFEKANPVRLLEESLEPTTGFETSLTRALDEEIGIFDLGGQENERWLGKDRGVFRDSDLILSVFPVTAPLGDVVKFLIKLFEVRRTQCPGARVILLLHKVDLLDDFKSFRRTHELASVLKNKFPEIHGNLRVYRTSIASRFFLKTLRVFQEIIEGLVESNLVALDKPSLVRAELGLRVLLEFDPGVRYLLGELHQKLRVTPDLALEVARDLQYAGFVEVFEEVLVSDEIPTESGGVAEFPTPLFGDQESGGQGGDVGRKPIKLGSRPVEFSRLTLFFELTERARFFASEIRRELLHPEEPRSTKEDSEKLLSFIFHVSDG
ncbi:MAG: ADP-ribosylation factor-like protein [Promethearchaeota archaeon]